jgi:hypothetical protein
MEYMQGAALCQFGPVYNMLYMGVMGFGLWFRASISRAGNNFSAAE